MALLCERGNSSSRYPEIYPVYVEVLGFSGLSIRSGCVLDVNPKVDMCLYLYDSLIYPVDVEVLRPLV